MRRGGLAVDGVHSTQLRSLIAVVVAITKKSVMVGPNTACAAGTVAVVGTRVAAFGSALTKTRRAETSRAGYWRGTVTAALKVVRPPYADSCPATHIVGVLVLTLMKEIAGARLAVVGREIAISIRGAASARL